MSLIIRDATPADARAIARVHTESWRETYAGVFPERLWSERALDGRVRMWDTLLARDPASRRIAVAERDGELIGFADSEPSRDDPPVRELELAIIYVLAKAHGSGVGQQLLDAVLGDEPASLWVLETNPRARAFYTRNGFVPDGASQGIDFAPGSREIRMVR